MKSTYPVHVPRCPGCSNPESCGECWLKLSNADQQRLLGGGHTKAGKPALKAVRAPRGGLAVALEELEATNPTVRAAREKLDAVSAEIRARPHPAKIRCAWIEVHGRTAIPCQNLLPYPDKKGDPLCCSVHAAAEQALKRPRRTRAGT